MFELSIKLVQNIICPDLVKKSRRKFTNALNYNSKKLSTQQRICKDLILDAVDLGLTWAIIVKCK